MRSLPILLLASWLAVSARAQTVEVLYTKVLGHPTANIPGALDLGGLPAATTWRALEDFAVKPDGTEWVVKGRTQLGSDLETILVRGSGTSGTMFCQEGQPFQGASAGELYDFFDPLTPVSWDTLGNLAFSARARGGVTTDDEKVVIVSSGGAHALVLKQGDAALGLVDNPATSSGDELIGNSIGSVYLINGGTVSFVNTPITNCSSTRYPALLRGNTSFQQSGVSTLGAEVWDNFVLDGAGGTPDGLHWFAEGDTENPMTTIDGVFVVDGVVVLQEGSAMAGTGLVFGDVFQASMASDGSWVARGRDNSSTAATAPDFALRNGALVAKTGDPVAGGPETWGDTFYSVAINALGGYAITGRTSSLDPARDDVLVVNGAVLMREGDQVDLDGDSVLDDAYIGRGTNTLVAFAAFDLALTDTGDLYIIVQLHNAAGVDLNGAAFGTPDAFLRVRNCVAPAAYCFGDGTSTACPCGGVSAPGNGCPNSLNPGGANLAASGTASIAADTLVLTGSAMPNSSALYFQGTTRVAAGAGVVFGDGLRCAGGAVIRLGTKVNAAGGSSYPLGADPSISVRGANAAGDVRTYQVWYRNAAAFCSPDTFNLTNGVEVQWCP